MSPLTLPEQVTRAYPGGEGWIEHADGTSKSFDDWHAELRSDAGTLLTSIGASSLREAETALDRDLDDASRDRLIWLLGQIGDRRSTAPRLARILAGHPDSGVRNLAAWALGVLDGRVALNALTKAIRSDPEVDVRTRALSALGDTRVDVRGAADVALERLCDPDEQPELRGYAAEALGNLFWFDEGVPEDVATAVRNALDDEAAVVRWDAAWAVKRLAGPEAVPQLVGLLGDRWTPSEALPSVATEAAESIIEILSRNLRGLLGEGGDEHDA